MADENQNNNIEAPELLSSHANIQIRTQETDVESLKQTGGAHPLPETVQVNSMPEPQVVGGSSPLPPAPMQVSKPGKSFAWFFWIVGLVALFLIGYFVVPLFFR